MIANIVLALALAQLGPDAPEAKVDTTSKAGGVTTLDVALLGPDRPIRVRLRLSVDGKTLNETWRNHLRKWFEFLDRDKNGELSDAEIANAPPPVVLLQGLRQGNVVYSSGLGLPTGAFAQPPRVDDFINYYLANGAGPLSVAPSMHQADPTSEMIFSKLDKNGDGKLTKDELSDADKFLRTFDADDDETVSLAELGGNPFAPGRVAINPVGGGMMGMPAMQPQPQIIILGRATNLTEVMVRYDTNKDNKLDRKEVAFESALFRKLDRNNDRGIDLSELIAWGTMAPEAEWSANWPSIGKVNSAAAPATTKAEALSLEDVDVRFAPLPRQNPGNVSPASYLLRIYQMADPSGKGVDKEALKGPQFQLLAQVFNLLDRDGDGKLVEKEVRDFVDLQAEGLDCHVSLSFADQGRGLFNTLDADRDGRLSKRELRSIWSRLESRDRDGDGAISPSEIPRQATLTAGFGLTQFNPNLPGRAPGMQPTSRPAYPQGVPTWFMRMDINGDGEISRREFLGTSEQFREFDTDGDGSISPEEAARKK